MTYAATGRSKVVVMPMLLPLLLTACPSVEARDSGKRPDIVVILSDDMGFSDIGCYGGEIDTPNLDRLAAGGLRFTQFYNGARCCPTRASLLTGLYAHQAGVGWMMSDNGVGGYRGNLNRRSVTIAEVLQGAGYRTYMTGKWHVTRHTDPEGPKHNWPLQRGFEKFYGTITGAGSFYDPTKLTRQNTMITPVNDQEYKPETYYYTDAISDNAVAYIREHAQETPDRPLFLYVAYTAAHWPMHALEKDIEKYKGKYDAGYESVRRRRFDRVRELGLIKKTWELSPQVGNWEKVRHKEWEARCMEVYAAMVDCMDRGIGRIVGTLKDVGRLDNTLILFLQDNGGCQEGVGRGDNRAWHLEGVQPMGPDELQPRVLPPMRTRDGRAVLGGPKVMPGPEDTYIAYGINWANVSNTPFREYKHFVHEGGISTPLIAHWPARIRRHGELEHQVAHIIDIMATCVDAAGATYPDEHDGEKILPREGMSLLPVFDGKTADRSRPIFWEHEGNRALRMGKWKLVAKGKNSPWELYDMDADRTETHDLASAQPEQVESLSRTWDAWARRAHVLPLVPYWPDRK